MIRAENMIGEVTRGPEVKTKINYQGTLTTTNIFSGTVNRREISLNDTSAEIPAWVDENKYCATFTPTSRHYLTGLQLGFVSDWSTSIECPLGHLHWLVGCTRHNYELTVRF